LTEDKIDDGIDNYEASDKITDAERVALRYSDMMANAPEKIGSTIYTELAEHYSEGQIIELGAFIGFNIGYHTFFGSLDFYPMFTPDGRLVDQEESRRIYGGNPVSHLDGAVQRSAAPDEAAE
jgi:hypothetical protein